MNCANNIGAIFRRVFPECTTISSLARSLGHPGFAGFSEPDLSASLPARTKFGTQLSDRFTDRNDFCWLRVGWGTILSRHTLVREEEVRALLRTRPAPAWVPLGDPGRFAQRQMSIFRRDINSIE